jgi:hypothetical protein
MKILNIYIDGHIVFNIVLNIYHFFLKNISNVLVNDILFPSIVMSITKANQIPNIQMEHSHLIIDPIVTQKQNSEYFHWAPYDTNIFDLLKTCSNLTCYAKNHIN